MTTNSQDLRLFVINLPDAILRRQVMESQLLQPGIPAHEFIQAVDGKALTSEELSELYDPIGALHDSQRELKPGEIGCFLSHRRVWQTLVERRVEIGGVLEDDAALGSFSLAAMELVLPFLHSPFPRVVLLQHVARYSAWGGVRLSRLHWLHKPLRTRGAHAYLINLAAAGALLKAMPKVTVVADNWMHHARWTDIRAVVPYCVGRTPASNESQIGPAMTRRKSSRTKAWLHKYFYEKFFYQIVVRTLYRTRVQQETW